MRMRSRINFGSAVMQARDTRLMQLHEIPQWLKDDPLAHDDAETVLLDRATRRENCAVRNYAVRKRESSIRMVHLSG